MTLNGILFLLLLCFVVFLILKLRKRSQQSFIANYRFNSAISKKVQERYPHLDNTQTALVMDGLREYFELCHRAKKRMVAMPSQVVDVAWHEFILFTRPYQSFCKKGIGRFLHHTPAEAMHSPTQAQDGIKRAWRLSCAKHCINPKHPNRLPLLFAIDEQLGIEDGFIYSLNCDGKQGSGYCAGHIGCGGGCGGSSGSNSGSGGFFDGFGGDSSGCGSCGGGGD
ncbi:hypothetical protein MIB92_18690 [Aestuariirhabdus sp. Z084]|uniref:glycine-rich domain-containing protein n=1 Tax=Aestuariirhabdus haliotis TaxID=2918751 RepID=UPI00201B4446|nr:hypothetical protein [Aestuariirhabdus haliotis]MCL6417694.1 hypothetical protein [Aestuariirhabdus haliotis]MCL6421633.1 hypothetical protein [Aestuariirhabdus haliotis]